MPRVRVTIDDFNYQTLVNIADQNKISTVSSFLKHLAFKAIKEENIMPKCSTKKYSKNTEILNVRLTNEEKSAFSDLAFQSGISETDFVRMLIGTAVNDLPRFTIEELCELKKTRNELRSVGRNLNQYIRAVNSGTPEQAFLSLESAEKLYAECRTISYRVGDLIRQSRRRVVQDYKSIYSDNDI